MYARAYVEITNICNMNCSFCHGHTRQLRRMSREEFQLVLDKLQGRTKYVYYHLMGEPLTHPLLPEFIRMARAQGFKSVITTNGTLLAKHGDSIISSAPHKVSISLHSFEGEQAPLAQQDVSLIGVQENSGQTEEAYLRYMAETADFAEKAADAGIIVVFRLWNRGHDGGRNDRTFQLLRERLDGEWAENTRGIRIRDKLHLEWGDRFEWPYEEAEVQGDEVFCYGLRDHFGILCDGTVVPCCLDSEGVIALGNVFEEELDAILGSPRAEALVRGFESRKASEELCKRCGYAQRFV